SARPRCARRTARARPRAAGRRRRGSARRAASRSMYGGAAGRQQLERALHAAEVAEAPIQLIAAALVGARAVGEVEALLREPDGRRGDLAAEHAFGGLLDAIGFHV